MRAAGSHLLLKLALATTLTGTATPAAAQLGTVRFDNWFYYQQNFGNTVRWQYRPRLFVPYALRDGWTFTQRVDLPFYYTDATGPANPDGGWKAHASDLLVEEIFDTPEVAKNLRLRGGLRLVFPTGGESPFGSDQWQVAADFGANWRLPQVWRGVTFAPHARYFYGFDPGSSSVTTKRSWDVFPSVTFALDEHWSLSLYDEQGMSYNQRTKKWFVPVEAMLTNRLSKTWEYSFGGAYELVSDEPSFRWVVQGRLRYYYQ